ncbi:MAG: ribosome biogenesis GTP-binding protein YihA/YsxC [Clostridia bacterium]|jgi:GTP-binding protein
MEIKQAEFYTSVVSMRDYRNMKYPEIGIVGKSNVGKSSFVNHLTNNYKLARVSNRPGKTRMLNFYKINRSFCLVDIPGYGYARISKAEKHKWGKMVEDYLVQSPNLCHVLLLVDIRHDPTKDDHLMKEWLEHYQIPFTLIATKCDKVPKSKWKQRADSIRRNLNIPEDVTVIPFSVPGKVGRNEVLDKIEKTLASINKTQ